MSGFFGSLSGAIGTITGALKWTGSAIAQAGTADLSDVTAPTSWTPTDQSGAGLTFTAVNARFCKVGNMVFVYATLTFPTTSSGATATISLPVPVPNQSCAQVAGWDIGGGGSGSAAVQAIKNTSTAQIIGTTGAAATNVGLTGKTLTFSLIYPAS